MNRMLQLRNTVPRLPSQNFFTRHSFIKRGFKSIWDSHNVASFAGLPTHPDELAVMIFGSSTDVGKTIISAGLSIAALRSNRKVCYIKPVQTGDMDEYFMQFYTNPRGTSDIFVRTLQHWKPAMSPHLAAWHDSEISPIADQDLLNNLQREIKAFVDSSRLSNTKDLKKENLKKEIKKENKKKLFTVVETAGGVLSPGNNQSTNHFTFISSCFI